MKSKFLLTVLIIVIAALTIPAQGKLEQDTIKTSQGNLIITFIGHGSLLFNFQGKNIFVDPFSRLTDYSQFPKADAILITHDHPDHLDVEAIDKIITPKTEILLTKICYAGLGKGVIINNGEVKKIIGLEVRAVPAYNLVNVRSEGNPYHPKGAGNGYVISFGDKNVYVAGDTENIPEMKNLGKIDIAFIPMNLPYTMTPEMAASAAKMIHPSVLYPYHYGNTDVKKLLDLLKEEKMQVKIRNMK